MRVPSGNENALMDSIAMVGPISTGFDASGDAFKVNIID